MGCRDGGPQSTAGANVDCLLPLKLTELEKEETKENEGKGEAQK